MSKTLGFKWLVGGVVGVSLLGACGAPADSAEELAAEQSAVSGDIAVSLSASKSSLGANEDVAVKVTFTNVSSSPVRLLKWVVPGADSIQEGLFEVTRNGEPVEYIGPHIKRPAPGAEEFVTLAPGESLSGIAPVSGQYDLSESGSYTVRFAAERALEQHHTALTKAAQLDSNLVNLWIEGRASGQPEVQAQGTVSAAGLAFSGACTSTEQSSITTALSNARTYSTNASNYLNGISSGTTRYTTWFGAFSSTNLGTARTHFNNIKNAMANAAIVVDCSCTSSAYAYVYPASPYKIYVCNAFWSAPMTGTDSKAGTLVHEMSHFNVVAATDDHAYGQSAAKNLAISSPTRALDNADNHEYFAENTPSLP